MLARAPRSAAEVAARLRRDRVPEESVAAAVADLAARGYLDDDALAARRAEELLLRRGWGPLRVRHELTGRGVADSVIERAIAAVLDDHPPIDLARRALRRKFPGRVDTAADRARAGRFLVRRGHPEDVVSALFEEED
jgi:regulatory protein